MVYLCCMPKSFLRRRRSYIPELQNEHCFLKCQLGTLSNLKNRYQYWPKRHPSEPEDRVYVPEKSCIIFAIFDEVHQFDLFFAIKTEGSLQKLFVENSSHIGE